ncbi:MAG: 3-isopropylmalate dehydratase small subunit [Candidatus Omnitrophica bacterium]|nr:3-isopropylmalate dehydratase small subunit [Candidatus Omnitrophota bacterium]MBU0895741.1 3-isopropylmalate dehydratase small subunit [Candidatus Omnitrophota bacterium]MBU1037665.1 3-isopropylmalate dehydratase small subunit [Candidatus Omnitrophota bacterium]MBU1808539.1 3-isopropylmalate dehydratase small subunit [Candidatus Omnitrophota bacterium]
MYKGKAFKFGDDINTDEIIPARYLNTTDKADLAKHCMEDADKGFAKKVRRGDIIAAGKNFGCGSSREHAPVSIKAAGVSCVIAENFARIFFRNCINIGLAIVESPEASKSVKTGDTLAVDIASGLVKNITRKETYRIEKYPHFMQRIIKAGGLMASIRKSSSKNKKKE